MCKKVVSLLWILCFLLAMACCAECKTVYKWGFIDKTGKFVVQPSFDQVGEFNEGFASARSGEKWGFIDQKGRFLVKPKYTAAGSFSEGLACVQIGKKVGFIDRKGKLAIPVRYDVPAGGLHVWRAGTDVIFSQGLAPAVVKGKWGFIDKTGKWVIHPQYVYAHPFAEGAALVRLGKAEGAIDKHGNWIASKWNGYYVGGFHEGLVSICVANSQWGFVDRSGKLAIEPEFVTAFPFSEGLAPVMPKGSHFKIGFIDKRGKMVIQPKYGAHGGGFSEGLAAVIVDQFKGKWEYIDKTGRRVIDPRFDGATDFHEGLAAVMIGAKWPESGIGERKDGKWGFINKSGKWVIQPRFEMPHALSRFSGGLAPMPIRVKAK